MALLLGHGLNHEEVLPHVWFGTAFILLGLCMHRWGVVWCGVAGVFAGTALILDALTWGQRTARYMEIFNALFICFSRLTIKLSYSAGLAILFATL